MNRVVERIASLAIGAIDLFFLLKRHVTYFIPFGLKSFDSIMEFFATFSNELFQASNDVLLLDQVGHFFLVIACISFFFAIKECIAGRVEAFPNGIAGFVCHRTYGLPLGL